MSFRPYATYSGYIALGIALVSGAAAMWLIDSLLQQSDPTELFKLLVGLLVALGLTGVALYWTLIAFKLDYHLNRNGLAIQWGLSQQRIPINAIEEVVPGKDIAMPPTFRGINLGGLRFGWGDLAGYGPLKFQTTAPLTQSLLIVTANQSYVISPRQPDAFVKAWRTRQELGPTQQWTTQVRRQWPFSIPLLADPLTWWLLGLAVLLCLALFGYISLNYPDLPPSLPVGFNSLGRADRIADKATLFILPAAGVIVWLVNAFLGSLMYRREKVGAYLLWGSSIAMQLTLWVAVLTITAG